MTIELTCPICHDGPVRISHCLERGSSGTTQGYYAHCDNLGHPDITGVFASADEAWQGAVDNGAYAAQPARDMIDIAALAGDDLHWAVAASVGQLEEESGSDRSYLRVKGPDIQNATWLVRIHPAWAAASGQDIWRPSTDGQQAVPLIERYGISVAPERESNAIVRWVACEDTRGIRVTGPTFLVAAMRAIVACEAHGQTQIAVPTHDLRALATRQD